MREGRLKIYLIFIVLLSSFYIVLPSVLHNFDKPFWLEKILPSSKVRLGLDLQGGVHMALGVEVEKVILENADRYAESLSKDIEKEDIQITSVARVADTSKISVKFANATDAAKIRKIISKYEILEPVASSSNEFVYDIVSDSKDVIKSRAVQQTIEAIRNRIDEFGVNEPSIQAQGSDRIIIQLPGVSDPARAKSIIGRTAKLEFKIVVENAEWTPVQLNALIDEAQKQGISMSQEGVTYSKYVEQLNKFAENKIPEKTMILFERKLDIASNDKVFVPYLLEKVSTVTGDHLKDAYINFDSEFNDPYVGIEFNPEGSMLFGELTAANIGKPLAIVLDNNIYSAPMIKDKITSTGQITLGKNMPISEKTKEAEDLALVLRAGSLPAQLVFEEERTVGPTLGHDSIRQGGISMILGAVFVCLFMLFYYRASGIVSNLALFLNILIVTSILVLFEATLTLPGIAGIVLTIGMAVDANIIIFERIREELRSGNNVKAAIETGYAKATSTVLDANITTAIAGIVLLQYGSGPIKGFAVTLLIGIFSSVFTAVYASKWIFKYYVSKKNILKLSI